MADEKKPRSERMYGKGPRIEAEPAEGDVNRSTNEQGAKKEVEKTAAKPEPKGDMKNGGDAKGDVMAGTDGIPAHHHEQSRERHEMHHRHHAERDEMMHRHEREHLMRAMGHHHEKHHEMNARHEEERRKLNTRHEREHREMGERHEEAGGKSGPTGGIKDKPEGKGGEETKT